MKQYHNLHPIPPPLLAKILIGAGLFFALALLIPSDYPFNLSGDRQTEDVQAGNSRR